MQIDNAMFIILLCYIKIARLDKKIELIDNKLAKTSVDHGVSLSLLSTLLCLLLGSLGDKACAFMHQLGRRIMFVTGERCANEFLWQRLVLPSSGGMLVVCWAQSTLLGIVRTWT